MARQKPRLYLGNYKDDWGKTWTAIPIKKQDNAFVPSIYSTTQLSKCGNSPPFRPRKIVAKFANGNFNYPFNLDQFASLVNELIQAGAECLSLIGERWGFVSNLQSPGINYGSGKTYDLSIAANTKVIKETGKFTYNPDVLGTDIDLPYIVDASGTDGAALYALQVSCMGDLKAGACGSGSIGIEPRHFIGYAGEKNGGKVVRKIKVNDLAELINCAEAQSPNWNCLGYQGETVANLEAVISFTQSQGI